ncbi:hypothetical protein VTN77DRAFT_2131 [Rasamsonia byssochlamydoides]|uniref:uncharacterized protein n=1 Tax=Rasamsonia byssochlamydoides TaxID=89139 RepID=UPI003742A240
MSSTHVLQTRLKEVSASLNEVHTLVNRLKNFTASIGQGDEARLELGAEIHARLKEAEEEMELLKVEVEILESTGTTKRKGAETGEKDAEKRRVVGLAERLTEELKRTRAEFRAAQLQANRNAEAARRKERELLLARPPEGGERQKPSEKLTHDDLVVNASSDVTAALRRTHQLMQAELSRSQFAQETLEQSTAALSSLSESYSNLDTILSSSRVLVSSLLRSQKSDTWYLETAFYILICTIAWLVFRRILYGPLWWLAWMPLKLLYRFVTSVIGVAGATGAVASSSSAIMSGTATIGIPTVAGTDAPKYVLGGGKPPGLLDQDTASTAVPDDDSMVEKIGRMVQESREGQVEHDGISSEETVDENVPRNPKKRMWEEDVDTTRKDEL